MYEQVQSRYLLVKAFYQSLKDIKVKKDQVISQGQVLGTATTNELDKDLGNHLHFELLVSGQNVNPEIYLDKELS